MGAGHTVDVVDGLLAAADAPPALVSLLQSAPADAGEKQPPAPTLLPLADLRRAVLGAMVNLLAAKLPADPQRLAEMMKGEHDKLAAALSRDALAAAMPVMGEHLQKALKNTSTAAKALL